MAGVFDPAIFDSAVFDTGGHSFTLDAYIGNTQFRSFTLDAIIRTPVSGSLTLDATFAGGGRISQDVVEVVAHATSQRVRASQDVVEAVVHATSSQVRVSQDVIEVVIFPIPAFTLDAFIKKTVTGSFTLNAFLKVVRTGTIALDAVILGIVGKAPIVDVVVTIKIDGVNVGNDVIFADAEFTAQVNGQPGSCQIRVRDLAHTYRFHSGQTLTLDIGSDRVWGGWVTKVSPGFAFNVDDTTQAQKTERIWVLEGVDYNILFSKRFIRNKAAPSRMPASYPAGTPDNEIILDVITKFLDLEGDGISTAGVTHVGTPNPDKAGNVADVGMSWGQSMSLIARATGAVFYISPGKVLNYVDVDTNDGPRTLSDTPVGGQAGYRDVEITKNGVNLVNDALVWGAGQGSVNGLVTFKRTQDAASIAAHGRWQTGEFRTDLFSQPSVNNRASSLVYGSPQSKRGGKDNGVSITCTTFISGFVAGQKAQIISSVFGYNDVLPIRRMTVRFPVQTKPEFTLSLSHEIDAPWSFAEFWWPSFNFPPITPPNFVWPPIPPILPPPSTCDDILLCGITDSFNRPDNFIVGTSDMGYVWAQNLNTPFNHISNGRLVMGEYGDQVYDDATLIGPMPFPLTASYRIQQQSTSASGGFLRVNNDSYEIQWNWDTVWSGTQQSNWLAVTMRNTSGLDPGQYVNNYPGLPTFEADVAMTLEMDATITITPSLITFRVGAQVITMVPTVPITSINPFFRLTFTAGTSAVAWFDDLNISGLNNCCRPCITDSFNRPNTISALGSPSDGTGGGISDAGAVWTASTPGAMSEAGIYNNRFDFNGTGDNDSQNHTLPVAMPFPVQVSYLTVVELSSSVGGSLTFNGGAWIVNWYLAGRGDGGVDAVITMQNALDTVSGFQEIIVAGVMDATGTTGELRTIATVTPTSITFQVGITSFSMATLATLTTIDFGLGINYGTNGGGSGAIDDLSICGAGVALNVGPYETLTGDGTSRFFTISRGSYLAGTTRVYLAGILQRRGAGLDYLESNPGSGTIEFIVPPPAGVPITVNSDPPVVTPPVGGGGGGGSVTPPVPPPSPPEPSPPVTPPPPTAPGGIGGDHTLRGNKPFPFLPAPVIVGGYNQAAVDNARASAGVGGALYFPPGQYDCNPTMSVVGQTWQLATGAYIHGTVRVTAVVNTLEGGKVDYIHVPRPSQAAASFTARNVLVRSPGGRGMRVEGPHNNMRILNCEFYGQSEDFFSTWYDTGADGNFDGLLFENNIMQVPGNNHSAISGNDGNQTNSMRNFVVRNNFIDAGAIMAGDGFGIEVWYQQPNASGIGGIIEHNELMGGGFLMSTVRSTNMRVRYNKLHLGNGGAYAAYESGGSNHTGAVIEYNFCLGTGGGAFVYHDAGAHHSTIRQNQVGDVGFFLQGSGAGGGYTIEDNCYTNVSSFVTSNFAITNSVSRNGPNDGPCA